MDTPLWQTLTQWLHTLGLHLQAPAAAAAVPGTPIGADLPHLLALAAALGWASGFRLFAVVFLVGLAGTAGWVVLPPGLQVLQHPALLLASGGLLTVEFFADKIPGVDSLWDLLQAVIRVPAGAALAAGALGADGPTTATLAALLGGTLAATSQAAKMTTRAALNTSPEPFSNLLASLAEDGLVVAAVWLALAHPLVFALLLVLAVVLAWALVWFLFRFLRAVLRRVGSFLSGSPKAV